MNKIKTKTKSSQTESFYEIVIRLKAKNSIPPKGGSLYVCHVFSWGDSVSYSWKWVSADICIEEGSRKKTFASTLKTHNGYEDNIAEGAVGWSAISSCRLVVPWLHPGVYVGEYAWIFVMLLLRGSPRVIGYNFHLRAVKRSLFSNIMPQAVSLSAPYPSVRVCMQIYSTARLFTYNT